MTKQKTMPKQKIIEFLILFYNKPQEDELKQYDNFNDAKAEFNDEIEYYLNKKVGLDAIYNSLINAANSFIMFRSLVDITIDLPTREREKLYISMNEPFINTLIISLSKLDEILINNKRKIINDTSLRNDFKYLDEISNRLQKSNIRPLRNGWFAHPFDDEKRGIIYKTNKLRDDIFSVLRAICREEHVAEFDGSSDRLLWFCEKYLMKKASSSNEKILNIKSRPMEFIKNIYAFSATIKEKKLYNIEPYFLVPDDKLEVFKKSPEEYWDNIK
ncbi:hypothetical protein [Aeromonas veronii]|uniref:hypothetical protein n=1 Tax=Aeromonas veronii TaxID=654 RepID=UPI001117AB25|nr:hypothetical protein [Aeromonas veronii]